MRSLRLRPARHVLLTSALAVAGLGSAAASSQAAVTFSAWPSSPFEQPVSSVAPPSQFYDLDTVDLNADPAPDLVAIASGAMASFPAPTFSPRNGNTPLQGARGSAAGDINGDGRRDLFLYGPTDKGGGYEVIGLSSASGLTATYQAISPDVPKDAALADFNGDGLLDAFTAQPSAIVVRVLTSTSPPTLSPAPGTGTVSTGIAADFIDAADVTGDGKADLLFSGPTQGGLIGIRTAPSFAAAGLALGTGTAQDVFLANVSGDARPEAVVLTGTSVRVYPITAAGQFGTPVVTSTGSTTITANRSEVSDLDQDGDQDLIVTTTAQDRVAVLLSNGDGTFAAPQAVVLPGGARRGAVNAITAADFDRDGDPDLAVSSDGSYRIDVLINGLALPPVVTVPSADQIAYETARVGASVDFRKLGGTAVVEYGETTAYGRKTPAETFTPKAAGDQPVSATLPDLKPETRYHARVVATNGAGTAVGADITFTTTAPPASDLAVSFTGPFLTVSGDPRRFTASVTGSYPPYTYAWNFGDGTPGATDPIVDHPFPAVTRDADPARIKQVGDASDAGEANTRRGSYDVTLTVADRFGRTAIAKAATTVVPNRAPVTSILPFESPLEYADNTNFGSGSHDPDAPLDRVIREEWSFGEGSAGTSAITRDPGNPLGAATCISQPSGKGPKCFGPGVSSSAVSVNPWRDDRRGLTPISQLPTVPNPVAKTSDWAAYNAQQAVQNFALALYPTSSCGAQLGSMTGCWPHKTAEKVKLRAVDGGGRDVTVEQEVPIRLRAQPAADVNLLTPGVDPAATGAGKGNIEQTGPIAAGRPDDKANPGTPLTFDPGTTIIDGDEEPVWYSVQIGQPWQASCKGKADITPDIPGPELTEPAKNVLSSLPPIDQLTGGDPNLLTGIETQGLTTQGLAIAKRARARAARFAPTAAVPGLGSGVVPEAKTPTKTKCLAGFGVKNPVSTVVSKDPKALTLTIPKVGEYSALLTVYDRTAATGKVRLDGIKVVQGQFKCSNVSRTMGKGTFRMNWSGTCVDGNNKVGFYWTKSAIDVNGVRIAPPDGSWMVIRDDPRNPKRGLIFTSSSVPKSTNPDDLADFTPTGTSKPVSFLLDDAPVATSKIAYSGGGTPRIDSPKLLELNGGSDARYGGLPIVTKVNVDFRATCKTKNTNFGGSQIDFEVKLPGDFATPVDGEAAPPTPTKPVVIPGCNPLDQSVITKVTDTGNYHRTKARVRGGVSWSAPGASAKARRTAVGIPSASMTLNDIWLGPVYIESFDLRYDEASKTFTGTGNGTLLEKKVTVRVVITNGSLTEAGGTVQVDIPLGSTPLTLKKLGFKLLKKNGITLVGSAQVTTSDGALVVANGTLEMQTSPVKLTLDGNAALAGGALPLAKARVEVSESSARVAASVGNSIGPFSYSVNISGAFSASAFNVEGSGRACVFACLGINGVLSSKGIAVCGEIDLWVHTFRPGFGYLYKGSDLNGYLDGCSLGPYRAVVGRIPVSSGGISPDVASKSGLAVRATLNAGQSQPVEVEKDQKILTLVARGAPGLPPRVTLTRPDAGSCFENKCATAGVITTPTSASANLSATGGADQGASADGYRFDEPTNSVVDVDRLKGEVRFSIANPREGKWTLAADAGSQTVTGVAYARDQELPKAGVFGLDVKKVSAKDNLATKTYGSLISTTTKPVATAKKAQLGIGSKTVITGSRISAKAIGPAYKSLLRKVTLNASALPGGDTVSFVERGADTAQSIVSYAIPQSGKLEKVTFAFLPGVGGNPDRHIDAYLTSPAGIPRGVVHDVDTFKASPPPTPKAPRIASLKPAAGKRLQISVKDEPAYGLLSSIPVLQVVVKRKNGGVDLIKLVGADFRKQGKVWVAKPRTGGDATGAKVELKSMAASGRIAKGAGRKLTGTVKR